MPTTTLVARSRRNSSSAISRERACVSGATVATAIPASKAAARAVPGGRQTANRSARPMPCSKRCLAEACTDDANAPRDTISPSALIKAGRSGAATSAFSHHQVTADGSYGVAESGMITGVGSAP